jgi:LysM repeat protein
VRRITIPLLAALLIALAAPIYADGPSYHTVAWGETLYSISRLYGIAPASLASANGLSLQSWVYAGQRLRLPGSSPSSPVSGGRDVTPSGIYTVRAGDTLTAIAQRFGLSVGTLADANNMPVNGVLYVGWNLKIPGSGGSSSAPAPAPQPAPSTGKGSAAYIVQPGDNLFRIALRYGLTTQAVAQANSLSSYMVYSGQRLIIPGAGNGTSDPPSPAPAPGAKPAPPPAPSNSNVRLSGIPAYKQQQTLTCEESAAAMALRGALGEAAIVRAMPRSDNPFKGIRGNTNHPYYGGLTHYGTYAQGLQAGLTALGRSSTVLYNQSFADFKNNIYSNLRAGKAVLWWTTWRQTYQAPKWVKTSDGASVKLVPYEHTVVIIGLSDAGVTYVDPYDASTRTTSWANFQRASGYFDNMALVIQ